MPLHLAWKSPHPKQPNGTLPGERFKLLRLRMKRPSRNNLQLSIGTRVLYMEEPGCVTALNIAAIGRWPAHLYPFIVQLDCGLTIRCHALDLDVDIDSINTGDKNKVGTPMHGSENSVGLHDPNAISRPGDTADKPGSTMWY